MSETVQKLKVRHTLSSAAFGVAVGICTGVGFVNGINALESGSFDQYVPAASAIFNSLNNFNSDLVTLAKVGLLFGIMGQFSLATSRGIASKNIKNVSVKEVPTLKTRVQSLKNQVQSRLKNSRLNFR